MPLHPQHQLIRSRVYAGTVVIVLILLALLGASALSSTPSPNHILPGTRVHGIDLGGKTRADAREILSRAFAPLVSGKLPLMLRDERVIVTVSSDDPAEPPILGVDLDATVNAAWIPGHRSGTGNRIELMRSRLGIARELAPVILIDRAALAEAIREATKKILTVPENAKIKITIDTEETAITLEPHATGEAVDVDAIIKEILRNPAAPLVARIIPQEPDVTLPEAERARPLLDRALAAAPISFAHDDQTWIITTRELAPMLALRKDGKNVALDLAGEAWEKRILAVAKEVNVPVQEARFRLEGGRVTEFAESREGKEVDLAALKTATLAVMLNAGANPIGLPIKTVVPQYTTDKVNDIGIKERLGRGATSFAGSPINRRKNIRIAVERLNGLLIRPGEEFSLLSALGPIDGAHGWLPELVIKGDRTIPEFGGGLCQIATTAFRVTLSAGMPVTARRNHSYRVPYYEPPVGMDATIYEPAPDYKFKNDMQGPILFTAAIAPDADHLTFELWGTSDGRAASTTTPIVWNTVGPPAKKIIETSKLEVGKEVCIERPHAGADAKFTYTVTYPDGRVATEEFKSHYRPWGAVCLRGVEDAPEISVSDARKADPAAAPPVEQRVVSPQN